MRTFLKRSLNLVENIIGAPMKKNHWFLLIHLFCFGFAYSAWNDGLNTEIAYEYSDAGEFIEVTYTHITNVDEFNLFAQAAKNAIEVDRTNLNANIILKNDIDLGYYFDGKECRLKKDSSISSFNPIPLVLGVFDGNNHTIRGYAFKWKMETQAYLVKRWIDQNLKIDSAYIQGDVAGALLGESPKGVDTKFINVHVSNSTIIGTTTVGGLAGKQVTSIDSSSVTGTKLVLQSENESGDIGGLMGRFDVERVRLTVFKHIIVCQNATFSSSLSSQTPASPQNIGGLVGSIQSEEVELWPTISISNSFVETDITTNENSNTGGLIGFSSINSATLSINSSYFKGNITSTSKEDNVSCIGGLAGSVTNVTIDKSFVNGNIKTGADFSIGGFVGQVNGNQAAITNSYQIGSIRDEKAQYKGLFIGSNPKIDAFMNIRSVYSVPDSGSSLEPVGYSETTPSFSGFIADENGQMI